MSDFRAKIIAELDTSKIPSQIKKIEAEKIILKNFTLNTKGLGTKIQKALDGHKFTLNLTNVKVDSLNKKIEGQMRNAGSKAGKAFSDALTNRINTQIATGGIEASVDKVQQKFEQLNRVVSGLGSGSKKTELQGQLQQVSLEMERLKNLQAQLQSGGLKGDALSAAYKEFNTILLRVRNTLTSVGAKSKELASSMEVATLQNKMQSWLQQNTRAAGQYGQQVQDLINKLKQLSSGGNVSKTSLGSIANEFSRIDMAAEQAGLKGKGFFNTFSSGLQTLSRFVSVTTIIYATFRAIRSGVNEVVALDTALIDLRKTTDGTVSQLRDFYYSANDTAKQLGVTTKDVIQAAAEWSRLGYTLKDAQTMSEVSSIFATISPGMDIDTATNGLISAMKAFNIEADDALDGIASKINAIGNSQAVSNNDIVQFLTRSSSAMKEANNSLEETIALGTAATEITRNAEQVGTYLKTISMRIRGYDEETEEFIGGVEELSGEIANLTKTAKTPGGISLFTDANKTEYKSTYQLLKEISEVYDDLTDKEQAELLEKLGGKRGGQIIAAILNNFDTVEKSLETMTNSAGSAMREMGIVQESLSFKLNALKETAVGVAQNLFNRQEVGVIIDVLTKLLGIIDKLTGSIGLFGTTLVAGGIIKAITAIRSQFKLIAANDLLSSLSGGQKMILALSNAFPNLSNAITSVRVAMMDGASAAEVLKTGLSGIGDVIAAHPILLAVATMVALTKIAIEVSKETERARDKLVDLKKEYSDNESELSSLNDQLKTTEDRISELESKDSLTFTEAEELNNLRLQNAELERSIDLLERQQQIRQSEINESFVDLMNKDLRSHQEYFADAEMTIGMDESQYINGQFKAYRANADAIAALDEKYRNDLTNKSYLNQRKVLEDKNREIEKYLVDRNTQFQDDIKDISYIPNPTNSTERAVNEWLDYIYDFQDRMAITLGSDKSKTNAIDRLTSTKFKDIGDKLKELGEQGEVTAELLGASEYDEFIQKLVELGVITENNLENRDEIAAYFNAIADAAEDAANGVSEFVAAFNIEAEKEGFENLLKTIQESVSSIGLSSGSIESINNRFADLDGYDPSTLFEKTANGIHLSTDALRKYENALESQKKLDINTELLMLRRQYNLLTKDLENASDAAERADLYKQRDGILAQIDDTAMLAAMYEGLTSSFYKWEQAQSIGEEGDAYDNLASKLKDIKQLYDDGLVGTEKFRAAVQLMTDDDLSDASVSELKTIYDTGYPKMQKYFTDSKKGIDSFISDLKNVNSEWATLNKETGLWTLNFDNQEAADSLGISLEMVQSLLRKASDYGYEVNFDSAYDSVELFRTELEHANDLLKGFQRTDFDFDFGDTNIESLEAQIEEAQKILDSFKNDDGEVNLGIRGATEAQAILEALIYQKQRLDQSAILSVDTSRASSDIELVISKLQEFKGAYNELEVKTAIGADTTDAETACGTLIEEISGLDAEILTTLGVDTTNLDTLNESIGAITPELMVTAGLDASLIEGYQAEDHKASGTVTWKNNVAAVTSWASIEHLSYGTVRWKNDTSGVRTHFTATGTVGHNSVNGTAFAGGNWGLKRGGEHLVGELGREIVVDPSTGRWFTVGNNGAEFVELPRGSIVFNHKQSEQLLANGHTVGRATALLGGTAFASGTKDEVKYTSQDWIEVLIDRIERAIKSLKTTAESAYKALSPKLDATTSEIKTLNREISVQNDAYNKYMQKANSVGLSSTLIDKVKNGTIDINEYDEDTKKLIDDYTQWYNKALDCTQAVQDLHEELASLYEGNFNKVQKDYEGQLELLGHTANTIKNEIDLAEVRGRIQSTKLYASLQRGEVDNVRILEKELSDLQKKFSEAMQSGEIQEYSDSWYSMKAAINSVKEEIQKANIEIEKYGKTIREIEWGYFDYLQDRISQITQESDFLIDLMSKSGLYDDAGNLSNTGMATAGLHAQNYNVYMAQSDQYAKELLELNKEISKDPYNKDLIERREKLLKLQRDSITAAEKEKQAIVSMVDEGIKLELSALKDLIDSYGKALDSSKNLYEYQNKVTEKTSEIASLQKQLSAYSNDTSEEARARIQKLQIDLSKAQEDLAKTEYDKMVEDQKKLLDELYSEYEENINTRIDDVDGLISDMIDVVNVNADTINDTIENVASNVGYNLTPQMQEIWNNSTDSINSVVSKYGEDFSLKLTSVNNVLSGIHAIVSDMINHNDIIDQMKQNSLDWFSADEKERERLQNENIKLAEKNEFLTGESWSNNNGSWYDTNGNRLYGMTEEEIAKSIVAKMKDNSSAWGDADSSSRAKLDSENIRLSGILSELLGENIYRKNGTWYIGNQKLYKSYSTGGLVDYTGIAKVDGTPGSPEIVLNQRDTENFLHLRDLLRNITSQPLLGKSYLSVAPALSGITDVSNLLASIQMSNGNMGTTFGDIKINIPIENVQDYNDFVRQLQKDDQFEKLILSMTVDRIAGKSGIEKYKYRW